MNRENSTRLPYVQVEYIDDICYPLNKACYFCSCCMCSVQMVYTSTRVHVCMEKKNNIASNALLFSSALLFTFTITPIITLSVSISLCLY